MTSLMPLKMTPEMHVTLFDALIKPPSTNEDKMKYARATLSNFMLNDNEYFDRFFMKKPTDLKAFVKWFDKKDKGESFTEREMQGIKALNSLQKKNITIAIFKELVLGIIETD